MLEKTLNGFTVIAAETDLYFGGVVVLASRRTGPANWEYVTARMNNLDEDSWAWGYYTGSLDLAMADFKKRLAG
jgi:hypothetical protein